MSKRQIDPTGATRVHSIRFTPTAEDHVAAIQRKRPGTNRSAAVRLSLELYAAFCSGTLHADGVPGDDPPREA